MKKAVPVFALCLLALSGCAAFTGFSGINPTTLADDPAAEVAAAVPTETQTVLPTPRPPPPTANTVATLDTTTAEDRAQALAVVPAPSGEATLGKTLATLGSPADPGIWIKTGLVTQVTQGRVDYQGTSINIELRPSGGPAEAGSQISLPAMRLLNAPLTGIVELTLYAGGAA